MEEADALCTRLAIMVKGVMRCIGSVQHLKNKYGAGYVLEIKWDQTNESIGSEKVKRLISSIFSEAVVKEEFDNRLIFDVPQHSVKSISQIFFSLENSRKTISGIEEYSFSQTTFEQVFINFAKEQEENE
jgi:ATP-binding cassette subfamily A (ABC1) protein 5